VTRKQVDVFASMLVGELRALLAQKWEDKPAAHVRHAVIV
jgi:hypothetical protein